MRLTLLTLLILMGMDSDLGVLLWFLALLPAAGVLAFVCLLLAARPPRRVRPAARVWQEGERHLDPRPAPQEPAHRRTSPRPPRGRHQPGRGRYRALSRQAQLEERTVYISPAALREEIEVWQAEAHEHEPYRDGVRIRCRTCKLDLPRPPDMPEIGAAGMHTWAGPPS